VDRYVLLPGRLPVSVRPDGAVELSLADATDFLTRKGRLASLSTPDGAALPWPATHVLVARRPLNT
jgi:hypothetical protein